MVSTYQAELSQGEVDKFDFFKLFDGNSTFGEDYRKAQAFTKKNGGSVYTMVDGDNGETVYLRGIHYVNRFAFCVIRI